MQRQASFKAYVNNFTKDDDWPAEWKTGDYSTKNNRVDVQNNQDHSQTQSSDAKEEVLVQRPAPPMLVPKKTSTLPRSAQSENVNGAQASTPTSLELAELRKEIDYLKANSVSRDRFNALEAECKELKEQITHLKSNMKQKIFQVMTEIDEEKKTRLNMQVEMDRLKTLVTS